MLGGPRHMMLQESSKPKKVRETLARFGIFFKPYWFALVFAMVMVVISTWTQVTSPELTGQLVDC
jgi:ATP-binding cassette, subfamily B, multidrug efflux pump